MRIRASQAYAGNLASQSVSRRPTSWGKMSAVLQTYPSATTLWKWWRNLSTLAPPSPATSLWTPSSTPGLARPQQQWPALQQEYRTNSMLTTNTKPACSAYCCIAAKPGHCTPAKNADSTPSICVALGGFWASPGRTTSQTSKSWSKQEYRACLPSYHRNACAG